MAWTERYCSPSGGGLHDGTSEANAWTLAEAITGVAAGHRVNVIAGTYANTTTSRTFTTAGTTTAPIWWRGYKTTIGDLDSEPATTRVAGTDTPSFTFTSGSITLTGNYQIFSNIDIQGSSPGTRLVGGAGTHLRLHRVRIECTENNSTSYAVRLTGNGFSFSHCFFKAHTGATHVVILEERGNCVGCVFRGGGNGLLNGGGASSIANLIACVFDACGNDGIQFSISTSAYFIISQCTFYGVGRDGIRIPTAPAAGVIANCIFDSCGGYGINNSSGTNTSNIHRVSNDFRNNTSGQENGFGDAPSLAEQTESSSPFTNAGSHDFSLVSGASAKAHGSPGLFENESYTSYLDIGAVQRQEPAGGVIIRPRRIM